MNKLSDVLSPKRFESFPILPIAAAAIIAGLVITLCFGARGGRIERVKGILARDQALVWSDIAPYSSWLTSDTWLYARDRRTSLDVNGRPRVENLDHIAAETAKPGAKVGERDLLLLQEIVNEKRIADRNAKVVGGFFLIAGTMLLALALLAGLFGTMEPAPQPSAGPKQAHVKHGRPSGSRKGG